MRDGEKGSEKLMPALAVNRETKLDCARRSEQWRIEQIARQLQRYLSSEHEECYRLSDVERAVCSWLEIERERLIEDAVELLTEPRFKRAEEFRRLLARTARTLDEPPPAQFELATKHLMGNPLAA